MKFLKQLFCEHHYFIWDEMPCIFELDSGIKINVPITLMECEKCGKRIVLRDTDYFYNTSLLRKINIWKKGMFDWERIERNVEREDDKD